MVSGLLGKLPDGIQACWSSALAEQTTSLSADQHLTIGGLGKCLALTIRLPPLMKIVTAREFLHSSITSILSFVVPNVSSRTMPAVPNFSAVRSLNLQQQQITG